jgi:hypothetical protein
VAKGIGRYDLTMTSGPAALGRSSHFVNAGRGRKHATDSRMPVRRMIAAMSDQDEPDDPRCPKYESSMTLVRTFPKMGGFPELRSYRCIIGAIGA